MPRRARAGSGAAIGRALDPEIIEEFRSQIMERYARAGRSFPWRETRDPWAILVSEVMLQQTQTERVVPKYLAWMKAFPEPSRLAEAPLAEVLALWSGLGYNRRALALRAAAAEIVAGGGLGDDEASLLALPGVGPYTARAVLAFAFGRPVILVETNIRSVFLHHFFPGSERVKDSEIEPLVDATLIRDDPRNWYYALMDYGVELKRSLGNPNVRSAHYARQSPFADSNRRIRGAILQELGARGAADADLLAAALPFARERVEAALSQLKAEGFVAQSGESYRIGE
jgi:A/G-specific adenine glycosylase